jgi:hypothetical protein
MCTCIDSTHGRFDTTLLITPVFTTCTSTKQVLKSAEEEEESADSVFDLKPDKLTDDLVATENDIADAPTGNTNTTAG